MTMSHTNMFSYYIKSTKPILRSEESYIFIYDFREL
jgi:hypothetical protein